MKPWFPVFFLAGAILIPPSGAIAQTADTLQTMRDLEYARRGDLSMKLDLYRPAGVSSPLPLVIWIHGGGWAKGSKDRCPATWLTEHGYAVASISYRLTDVASWPAQIDDCREAVRWLRSHALEHGLDAARFGAWGPSAGGHLVAMLGTATPPADEKVSSRIQAVCDFYGPTDLVTMPLNVPRAGRGEAELAASYEARLLGGIVRDRPELARQAGPLHQASGGDAPFLIVHGSKDAAVPLEQSRLLHEKLLQNGVESTLHVIEGAAHGGKEFQTADVRERILKFFDRHLKPAPAKP